MRSQASASSERTRTALRRGLVRIHRYLGVALCLLFVVWFVSGITMVFANDMPHLTEQMRYQRLPPLDVTRIRVPPLDALRRAAVVGTPDRVSLVMVERRPAYRFADRTVFADTGDVMPPATPSDAVSIASTFMRVDERRCQFMGTVQEADQWTIAHRQAMPLHRIAVDDGAGTELYVSSSLGQVVVMTTRATRLLAMAGAIPHWLYFTRLRVHAGAWRQVVLWTSGAGVFLALSGLVVGVLQLTRARSGRGVRSPYVGWMKWHHIAGLAFGLFTLTWVFSGFLSMQPWDWASDRGRATDAIGSTLSGGTLDLSAFQLFDADRLAAAVGAVRVKEMELARLQGEPYYLARDETGQLHALSGSDLAVRKAPFTSRSMLDRVHLALPGTPIRRAEMLSTYDAYYYSRDTPVPMPVLRVILADAQGSWLYLDPATSRMVARITRRGRVERWLYHGLHSLDFPFWYYSRPAWTAGVVALLCGGLTVSVLGLALAIRRARGVVRRAGSAGPSVG